MGRADSRRQQQFMKARVGMQAFTIGAIGWAMYKVVVSHNHRVIKENYDAAKH
jgi:hypothetical protein